MHNLHTTSFLACQQLLPCQPCMSPAFHPVAALPVLHEPCAQSCLQLCRPCMTPGCLFDPPSQVHSIYSSRRVSTIPSLSICIKYTYFSCSTVYSLYYILSHENGKVKLDCPSPALRPFSISSYDDMPHLVLMSHLSSLCLLFRIKKRSG